MPVQNMIVFDNRVGRIHQVNAHKDNSLKKCCVKYVVSPFPPPRFPACTVQYSIVLLGGTPLIGVTGNYFKCFTGLEPL